MPDGSIAEFNKVVASSDDGLGTRIVYAGRQQRIREYLKEHPDWSSENRTALVRTLVESEIDASNGEVGGPIDILAIEHHTVHWVQRKPECK
jgi:hypothetical protein